MKIDKLDKNQIIDFIKIGLDTLIKGFENVGFRKTTKERLKTLEEQVALLSKKIIDDGH